MSYYVALFGPGIDLSGLRDVHTLAEANIPELGLRTMAELVSTFSLTGGRFLVDETGDTAHELVTEAWSCGPGTEFEATRLGQVMRRAENARAWVAIWDAECDEPTSWPQPAATTYADARALLSRPEPEDEWIIKGMLVVPQGHPR